MYTLYIGNKNYSSWSLRPWVLMSELDLAFHEELVPFAEGGSWEQFRRFSPSGLVPCLVDGERAVWDSLAIAEYLAERHPGVWPEDAAARAWARCAAAEMHAGFSALRNLCPMNCALRVKLRDSDAGLQRDLARLAELWGEGLARFGGPFLAGATFTAVDAFYAPVAFRLQTYSLSMDAPADAYAQHLLALPAMQRWYAAAIAEPWVDAAHEEEAAQIGEIVANYRVE
ncbi:glutathione S-transferase family protein [Mangrovimicrobium sediminis]|uniref:Glutathione S-transferase family protein n=1 Tax=Mangrovimicrobium sediminis TaxID=2562682 RepID=A0A4Z0LZ89_9GAMM|nr:glutathione S-transferase family protein [Haliea sp. SAOS-164]TGD72589.1 glutathione S-transferase family protein [Haliea sp. SAOS-164]